MPHMLAGRSVDGHDIFDCGAEAGRTNHRAVATGETAVSDVVPAGMIEVAPQQFRDLACGRHHAAHLRDGFCRNGGGGFHITLRGFAMRQLSEHGASHVAASVDDKPMFTIASISVSTRS